MARKTKTNTIKEADHLETHHDKIRQHAYEQYLKRIKNNEHGDALHDWLIAEKEVQQRSKAII